MMKKTKILLIFMIIAVFVVSGAILTFSLNINQKNEVKAATGVWTDYAASSFGGGTGTENDPYLISTAEQLAKISLDSKNGETFGDENNAEHKRTSWKYFKQTANIDLSAHEWYPIGYNTEFYGDYNGCRYKITGLTINSELSIDESHYQGIGLFGKVRYSTILNVDVSGDISLSGKNYYMAGIIGRSMRDVKVYNCINRVNITFNSKGYVYLGGILGVAFYGVNIINCYNYGNIFDASDLSISYGGVGGIIGGTGYSDDNYNISQCFNYGNITGETSGGIAGDFDYSGCVEKCLSNATISGEKVGGIVGEASISINQITISNCIAKGYLYCKAKYATSNSAASFCGSIVGRADGLNIFITACYFIGESNYSMGLFFGTAKPDNGLPTITACFSSLNDTKIYSKDCNWSVLNKYFSMFKPLDKIYPVPAEFFWATRYDYYSDILSVLEGLGFTAGDNALA